MSTYVKIHNDDELYHYGIKGMKWHKRKAKPKEIRINEYSWYDGSYQGHTVKTPRTKIGQRFAKGSNITNATKAAATHAYYRFRVNNLTYSNIKSRRSLTKTLSSFGKRSLSKAKKAISKGKSVLKNKFKKMGLN